MNIDDEIEKLNKERDALLIEVVKTRNTINELARKIRSLETVKRHASEILNSKGSSNIVLTKEEEISGDFVKDPAQLDLEVENPDLINGILDNGLAGKVIDMKVTPGVTAKELELSDEQRAEIIENMKKSYDAPVVAPVVNKKKDDKAKSPSIIDSQIKDAIRNGEDPYVKYTGLVKESHIKKMVDEVIAENACATPAEKALELGNAVDEFLNS